MSVAEEVDMAANSDPSLVVFYDGPDIVVTNRYIETRDGLYPLPSLLNIHRLLPARPRRPMELRADHAGQRITLFSSRDRAEFEKVRWAIVRAVEANRPLRP
jgi:Family of unknown function (DUF6232)